MFELIISILPFAVGVFASPLPVVIAIVMLFTPHARPTSVTYVVTWVTGLTVVTILFILMAGALEQPDEPRGWLTWLRIILGVLVLVMGVRMWLGRTVDHTPPWLTSLMNAGSREALRYGILMSAANPKELLMALAAGLAIGTSGLGFASSTVALVVFVAVGAASVAGPLIVFLLGGDKTLARLERAREWLQTNNTSVAAVVMIVIGLLLVIGGVRKFIG